MSFSESLAAIVAENRNHLLGIHPSWKRIRLGDIADIQNGFPFASEQFSPSPPGMPLIRIRDILRNPTTTYFQGEYPPEFIVKAGALLVGMDGDFNSAVWHGEPALLNQRCCKVSLISNEYDHRLLAYCLPGYLAAINAHTSAITVKHLSSRTVSDIPLPLPPVGEQQRIADTLDELFSDLDAGVAALERVRAKLKHYRAAVLKAAVEGALTANWREQHPDTESAAAQLARILTERRRRWEEAQLAKFQAAGKCPPKDWQAKYKEPVGPKLDGSPLSQGWCWATADQLCTLINDGEHIQPSYQPVGFPMLTAKHVRDGFVEFRNVEFIGKSDFDACLRRCAPEENDVLIVSVGATTGRAAIVGRCDPFAIVRSVLLLKPIVSARYLLRWIQSPWCQTYISRASGSSAQAHLYIADTKSIPVPLPPLEEQEAIVAAVEDQLSVIEHLEGDLEAKLKSAQALRRTVLRHAFTGQLVPQDPNDEPASKLLIRIAAERDERARQATGAKLVKRKPQTWRRRAAKN